MEVRCNIFVATLRQVASECEPPLPTLGTIFLNLHDHRSVSTMDLALLVWNTIAKDYYPNCLLDALNAASKQSHDQHWRVVYSRMAHNFVEHTEKVRKDKVIAITSGQLPQAQKWNQGTNPFAIEYCCNNCKADITSTRWRCTACPNWDYCDDCHTINPEIVQPLKSHPWECFVSSSSSSLAII